MISSIADNKRHTANEAVCRKYDFRLGEDLSHNFGKHAIAVQCADYQAFTPPPPPNVLIIKQLRAFCRFLFKGEDRDVVSTLGQNGIMPFL
ncbi:MAG: hypothetical protein LBR36_01810, partial [Bacteroidales bacterium]|nr:hypothetical protein [Bacteroidales bacterium]